MKREQELYARLKLGDAEVEFRGSYDEVWRSINRFLSKATTLARPTGVRKTEYIPRRGSLGERIMVLRRQGWFDTPKTAKETQQRVRERMALSCDLPTMSKELMRMVRRGVLKRSKTEEGYVYSAPWVARQT